MVVVAWKGRELNVGVANAVYQESGLANHEVDGRVLEVMERYQNLYASEVLSPEDRLVDHYNKKLAERGYEFTSSMIRKIFSIGDVLAVVSVTGFGERQRVMVSRLGYNEWDEELYLDSLVEEVKESQKLTGLAQVVAAAPLLGKLPSKGRVR